MTYQELKALLCGYEADDPETDLTAYITFSSFGPNNDRAYSWEERTYMISSDNKAFQPNMGGYSIYGYCLDGSDQGVRLERLMAEEHGGKDGWVVEDCCIVGYLLISCSDGDISTPMLFYSSHAAHEQMLRQFTHESEIDFERLKAACANQKEVYEVGRYEIRKDSAWWSDQATVDWKWSIQPVRIYSPLRIVFSHE